jgi:filamentous hemagglutinin family protein
MKLKSQKKFVTLVSFLAVGTGIILFPDYTLAQIIPDTTLPVNSRITKKANISTVEGGTQAGGNLFHSFLEFSIPDGNTAYFNNAATIQNIITRITGGTVSNINGIIRTNGIANLFLINPKGFIFGNNAKLNIAGSFLVSTANSLIFADGNLFSAVQPENKPLLTIKVPLGFQFGANPGRILLQGNGQGLRYTSDLVDTTLGLHIQPNQTLALVGGDVVLEGGTIKTAGGRIELGSVAGPAFVGLTPTSNGLTLDYQGIQNFQDIKLSQQAAVDASGKGSGDIQIQGRQISLTGGSQVEDSTLGAEAGGTLLVKGSESVELNGTSFEGIPTALGAQVYPKATGAGGKIVIETGKLIVRNGAQISSDTLGAGNAGTLTVSSRNSVEVSGASTDGLSLSGLYTLALPGSSGDGGDLNIKTGQLIVQDGGQIASDTFATGSGGSLTIFSRDSIAVLGVSNLKNFTSNLSTVAEPGSMGNGGKLMLETSQLIVKNGGIVSTATFGEGLGGPLSVKTDSIELSSPLWSDISLTSGLSSRSGGVGNAGTLTIESSHLSVDDGSQITVSNSGTGSAGFIQIDAKSINLNNQGRITASTASGEGGNIFLNTKYFQLSNYSTVTATAGSKGNGGNIDISADILTAWGNSKITANAFEGRGGNINITGKGFFISRDTIISASSEKGIDGTVQFNGGIESRPTYAKPEGTQRNPQIVSACRKNSGVVTGKFVIIGTGSLPPTIRDQVSPNTGWLDNSVQSQSTDDSSRSKPATQEATQIVEATTWTKSSDGSIYFVPESEAVVPNTVLSANNSCFNKNSLPQVPSAQN